ncbi:MAG: hypothetical protein R3314_09160 [Longimicrobiales bacterium]|nr:hypothetical protein [Longimicrobiales bacterium]
MRATVLLLMVVQLVAFPLATHAEGPHVATAHTTHVSAEPEACQPFHDELTCITCRVLSADPVTTPGTPALATAPTAIAVVGPAGHNDPHDALPAGAVCARAPPRT